MAEKILQIVDSQEFVGSFLPSLVSGFWFLVSGFWFLVSGFWFPPIHGGMTGVVDFYPIV